MFQIICTLMHGCVFAVGILRLVNAVRGKSVKEKPVKLYDIADEFLCLISLAIWIRSIWDKKKGYHCLLRSIYAYVPLNGSNLYKKVSPNND